MISYPIALMLFDGEYVFIQYETHSGLMLFSFEEMKIIAYLETKNIQDAGTQGPHKLLIHVLQHERGEYEGLGVNV
jgi:hypothetical protein